MKRLWAAAFTLALAGCTSSTLACTAIGCVNEASLRLHDLSPHVPYPLAAHACFDQQCVDVIIDQQKPSAGEPTVQGCTGNGRVVCADVRSTEGYVSIAFDDAPPGNRPHSATIVVRDAHKAVVMRSSQQLTLAEFAPNGERCAPICWSGAADFR
jgi:hypothetical protein